MIFKRGGGTTGIPGGTFILESRVRGVQNDPPKLGVIGRGFENHQK